MRALLAVAVSFCAGAMAQTVCQPTPMYSPCEIGLELSQADAAAHPNPYASVDVWAEIRSPGFKTYRVYGFWDGGLRFKIRFSPTEAGDWTFKFTSNAPSLNGKSGSFSSTPSDSPGFIRAANVHHWQYTEGFKPHLWMGDTCYRCGSMERSFFDQYLAARAAQKFTHIRLMVVGFDEDEKLAFPGAGKPNPAYFQELDSRVSAIHARGIVSDLILGADRNRLAELFSAMEELRRYIRYVVARYAAFNATWQAMQEYEEYKDPRPFAREVGKALKEFDPYSHPRTTHTLQTSSALVPDGWMDHILYQSSSDSLGAVEHQAFPLPQVNSEFGYEDSGAGKTHAHHVDSETLRKRLWNATMNGQYPTFGNTGTYGSRKLPQDPKYLESPGATAMTAWFDFFSRTRFFELEPYFDVDGARAIATPDVEYIVYIEKPGPVEIKVVKRTYQVYWFNPATGDLIKEKKDWKGKETEEERQRRNRVSSLDEDDAPTMVVWSGSPPDNSHDWVLHLSRDGRKEGLYKSYKFESRRNVMQEPELSPAKLPFELVAPKPGETLVVGRPVPYEIRLKRDTLGTRRMDYVLKAEVASGAEGARFLAAGPKGEFRVPAAVLKQDEASLILRVSALNAFGKLYSLDLVYPVKRSP